MLYLILSLTMKCNHLAEGHKHNWICFMWHVYSPQALALVHCPLGLLGYSIIYNAFVFFLGGGLYLIL